MFKQQLADYFRRTGAVKFGQFTLASGKQSDFYVNAKAVVSNSTGMLLAARCLVGCIIKVDFAASVVAGMAEGANNLLGGLLYLAGRGKWAEEMHSVLIRKQAKGYGTGGVFVTDIENPSGMRAVVVEDVTTTGQSAMEAVRLLREAGYDVRGVVTLVDRQEGAAELFAQEKVAFHAALNKSDLLAAQ